MVHGKSNLGDVELAAFKSRVIKLCIHEGGGTCLVESAKEFRGPLSVFDSSALCAKGPAGVVITAYCLPRR